MSPRPARAIGNSVSKPNQQIKISSIQGFEDVAQTRQRGVQAFAIKPGDLSSIPKTHMVDEEN